MKNNFKIIDKFTGHPIDINQDVLVYEPNSDIIVGQGWFEFNPEDGYYFREDFSWKMPSGMRPSVIQNIFDYEFKRN